MTGNIADDTLRSGYERWLRLEEAKAELADDLKELFAELKANGFDGKALRISFRRVRDRDDAAVAEQEALVDLYVASLTRDARDAREAADPVTGEIIESHPADAPATAEADGPSGDEARRQFEPLPETVAQEVGVQVAGECSSGRTESSADGQLVSDEAAAATETSADYLRKPAAVVSGQIIREGDAPRETGRREGDNDHQTGEDASCPDAESQANVDDETAPVNGSESAAESASRPDAGRSASATSEIMDVTVGGDQSGTAAISPAAPERTVGASAPAAPIRDTVLSLRPHCQNPDTCASAGGKNHCFNCRKAAWLDGVEAT